MTIPIYNNTFDESQASCAINGVPCGEYVRDYYEAADRSSGPDLSKSYICQWSKRFTVANACLGLATATSRNGSPIFLPPLQHPEIPTAFCGSLRITGKGMPFQGPSQLAFPAAMITIGFKSYPWNFQGTLNQDPGNLMSIDPATSFVYATQEIDQGEETVEFRGGSLQWVTASTPGGTPVPIAPKPIPILTSCSVPIAYAIMRITFKKLPYMPVATLPLMNNLNNAVFLGCPIGTVKFKGSSTDREYQSDGSMTQSVMNTYHYRPVKDWNYVPNPNAAVGNSLWGLRASANGAPLVYIFPYSDLTQTFPDGYAG
jgi:hypothetical protein